ncbi:MAG: YdeI/OmpD-associated family protein [Candidatus Hydrogenedentes bacterium]|nr:YdeI/OmpD-associated family protein [Candidatus Hydrogenedentota bacterium]
MSGLNPKIDGWFRKAKQWQEEMLALRAIAGDCGLMEELKWRQPCYTFDGHNVVIIGAFKNFCVMSFFKGALLKDPKGILEQLGENTQSGRTIRLTSVEQIKKLEPAIKALIKEAIKVEKAGLKVEFKKITERPIPEELEAKFKESPALKKAFNALTPGRQREYLLHFSSAKQSETRTARIEKCAPKILKGEGFSDDYKSKMRRNAKG